jgi:hypothetical protein
LTVVSAIRPTGKVTDPDSHLIDASEPYLYEVEV